MGTQGSPRCANSLPWRAWVTLLLTFYILFTSRSFAFYKEKVR